MIKALLDIDDLQTFFRTRRGIVRAVNGVSLQIESGETVGIVGESGSGKSMIAQSIMRLVPAPGRIESGSIEFEGMDLCRVDDAAMRRIRGRKISMIFQEPVTSLNPVFTCGYQIQEVLMLHQGMDRRTAKRSAAEALRMVGIPHPDIRARQYPHHLSGGMQQRVMIAMAVACRPALLIADEPTTALDVTVQARILKLLIDMQREMNMSMLIISHDFDVVARVAKKSIVMYAGRIVEQAPTDKLLRSPEHPYTVGLLNSRPRLDRTISTLSAIEGAMYDPLSPPEGCSFHTRCPHVMEICRRKEPILWKKNDEHEIRCWMSATD